jgi:MSHA biogenesis protein MshI
VAIAHLSRNKTGYQLEHVDYAPANGLPEINSKLAHWVKEFQVKDSQTNFVLSLSDANILLTEAPEVEDKELSKAMRWKLKDNPDVNLEKSIVDVFPIPGQRERGRQPMAYVVSAEKKLLKNYVSLIEKNDLQLTSIDITAMALRNIASQFPEDEQGVAFLSLNARRGLLSLSRKGDLYLTRDLEVGYQSFASEEVSQQGDMQIEGLPPATQQTLEQIVLEVQRSMDYYERYFAQPPIQNLVLAPLPSVIPGLSDEIAHQLGMKVRELDISEIVDVQTSEFERGLQSQCLPAIGAALRMTMVA